VADPSTPAHAHPSQVREHHEGHPDIHPQRPSAGHAHEHQRGPLGWVKDLVAPHSHDAADSVDTALETSTRGTRALLVSLVVLGVTALLQGIVVTVTGSVALLGDTLHNVADALTAVPLAVAFSLGRRPPTRRYTYGYGRAEDLAGVAVVLVIVLSSLLAAYEAVQRLLHPRDVHHLLAVGLAGLLGFIGNEVVARYRITVGRDIGSAALVADGLHARTDGFTSLAVVVGAIGIALGFRQADPIVGLMITLAILLVLRDAARQVYRRLMDAVDEDLVTSVETVLLETPGVVRVGRVRLRWIGHALRAECEVVVAADLSLTAAHAIAVDAEHRLLHDVRRLTAAIIHPDPDGEGHHVLTAHHDTGDDDVPQHPHASGG
jgi:cation diffusion facilitator family transporter